MNAKILIFLILCFVSVVLADDFKTIDGKEYKNATVSRVELNGIVLKTKSGISKVYFVELPKEVQERFHYDPQKSREYSAEQNANLEALRKQQEEAMRQRQEGTEKKNKAAGDELSASEARQGQREKIQKLQARYNEFSQQEDELLLQIGQAGGGGSLGRSGHHRYYVRNALADQLPYLQSHLNDVRHDKDEVRKQLEQAQR